MEAGKVRKLEPTPGWCERAVAELMDTASVSAHRLYRAPCGCSACALICEYESAQQPAPAEEKALPHEIVGSIGWYGQACKHCRRAVVPGDTWMRDACPARAPNPPGAELKGEWWRSDETNAQEPACAEPAPAKAQLPWRDRARLLFYRLRGKYRGAIDDSDAAAIDDLLIDSMPIDRAPEAEKVEELPEEIAKAIRQHSDEVGSGGRRWALEDLCRLLLAEVRRTARRVALGEVSAEVTSPRHIKIVRRIAREEIAAARWERFDGGPRMVGFEGEWKDASDMLRLKTEAK